MIRLSRRSCAARVASRNRLTRLSSFVTGNSFALILQSLALSFCAQPLFLMERTCDLVPERLDQVRDDGPLAGLYERFGRHARDERQLAKTRQLVGRNRDANEVVRKSRALILRQIGGDTVDLA